MAIGDIGDTVGEFIPGISFGGIFGAIAILFIILIFGGIAIFIGYMMIQKKRFNKTINIFEKINGRIEHTSTDKAREMKIGRSGDSVFFLKRAKKALPTPTIQMGRRKYWYYIREDGEWINFGVEDIDAIMKLAGVHYLDKEMRYARTALEQGLKERFDKPNFWKEYGVMIASIGFIVILGVMMFLLFDKWIELASVTNEGVKTSGEVMKLARDILSAINNIQTTTVIPS